MKFPHLIQSCTIEKFLPYHAACSQGHLEILKLLAVSYDSPHWSIHTSLRQVYDDGKESKYFNSFDFNSLDMNDQSGLHLAVLGNHYHICEYLLGLNVKKLDDNDLAQFNAHQNALNEEKLIKQRTHSQLSSKSAEDHDETQSSSYKSSFFDHIKNVFLDIKSYDPYVINYTSNTDDVIEEKQVETKSVNSIEATNETLNNTEANITLFNPIGLNYYSKFGTTCLHEAIRNKNFPLVKLLVENGADVNLPIYENSPTSQQDVIKSSVLSNCLCEALKQKDEQILGYLLENNSFTESNLNLAFKQCLQLAGTDANQDNLYSKTMIAHLLKLKILNDPDNKVNIRSKQSLKQHLHNSTSSMNISELSANNLFNSENGLILNWNNLDLSVLYESVLFNSSRFFLVNNKMLRNISSISFMSSLADSSGGVSSMFNEEYFVRTLGETATAKMNLNLKRLHLNVITRIDLANNQLENIPFALFQIENLKFLKLSSNKLKKLPTNRLDEPKLDDVNNELIKFEKMHGQATSTWNCNYLEEIELDKNQLVELPVQLFQIKSLKHLNASSNSLESVPVEMWTAPSLVELNLAFNKLTHLPLVSKNVNETIKRTHSNSNPECLWSQAPTARAFRRNEAPLNHAKPLIPVNDHPLKKSITQNDIKRQIQLSYEEKPIDKANFWQNHSIDSPATDNNNNSNNANQDFLSAQSDEKNLKKQKQERTSLLQTTSSYKESKLVELNLSNNKFKRIPECLSCLSPKLAKLNLSFNLLENMGALCDLPASLKFLDLSNNKLKRPMRLLNDHFLKFAIFYYTKYINSTNSETSDEFKQLLENNISNLLLDNEFCYLNLFKKYFFMNSASSNNNPNQVTLRPSVASERSSRGSRAQEIPPTSANVRPQNEFTQMSRREVSRFSAASNGNTNRRARSQSRNHRAIANVQTTNANPLAKRVLPFDLFLINLKYNRSMRSDGSNEQEFLMAAIDLLLNSSQSVDFNELEKKEKLLLDSQNMPIFLEQMCSHKRHYKLENLKSLNLSNNKLKHFHLMFDFPSSRQIVSSPSTDLNFIPSFYSSKSKDNSRNAKEAAILLNLKDVASGELSSDSDFTLTESDLSSVEDYDVIRNNLIETGEGARIKLKERFFVAPLKKSLIEKKNKNLSSFNRNEERVKMISKLLYPNLTHLDFSSNKIRFVPRNLIFLENLSYLNVASNRYLIRVSPSIGLLKKLWNFDLKSCDCLREPANLSHLVKQKTKTADILGFLRSILEDSRPYTRIKLMFVGVQGIGKTSVLNRLREESGTLYTGSNRQSWSERQSASHNASSNHQNISTVGIDINEWTFEEKSNKKNASSSSLPSQIQQKQSVYIYQMENSNRYFGPITFRTWDFAGQRDYYATHQYFISKRALYLVCWKLSEEEKGINEIHNWLSNIQTRAPGSPVIIVGTHQDQLAKLKNYKDISNYLQRLIFERFVRPTGENETSSPYPPIVASIEISSKTGYNVRQLAKLIYDAATQMKAPGIKDQLLLEQKIPVTYLALEECINYILKKLKVKSRNPILHTNNYLKEIRQAIEELYPDPSTKNGSNKNDNKNLLIRFRDDAEILQATQFLHDNGIVIHYNDVALRDLYFLDPQWLCDILSTVITIREINPFAAKGIMRIKDLFVLFKGKKFSESEEIVSFIVDLLSKFELALTWDNEHLLIPSLLPSEAILKYTNQDIRIGILSKKKIYNNNSIDKNPDILLRRQSRSQLQSFTFNNLNTADQDSQISSLYSNVKLSNSYTQVNLTNKLNLEFLYECKPMLNPSNDDLDQMYVRRIYTLSYLPTGFFSRLITRILCDNILKECLLELIDIEYCFLNQETGDFSNEANSLDALVDFVCQDAEWRCWQTGIELKYLDFTLLKVKEIQNDPLADLNSKSTDELFLNYPVLYRDCEDEFKMKSPSKQCAFIECYTSFKDYKIVKNSSKLNLQQQEQQENDRDTLVKIFCKRQVSIKIFALIIEIIDTLLEDWYPDLGTRFMQDSKGDYLVTRLAPCYKCINLALSKHTTINHKKSNEMSENISIRSSISEASQDAASNDFLTEDDFLQFNFDTISNEKLKLKTNVKTDWIYCFMLDDVCHSVLKNAKLICPKHSEQSPNLIAPDLAFEDIEEKYLIKTSHLKFENIIGRGSFGSVYTGEVSITQLVVQSGSIKHAQLTEEKKLKVAIKVLETFNNASDLISAEVDSKQMEVDLSQLSDDVRAKRLLLNYKKSIRLAAKAYSIARQEVAIVSSLKHENIVAMIGLTLKPLAIILELASGNLKDILTEYKTNMSKLSPTVIQQVCTQTSSALVYLHSNRIIYRDLKSENVLVFNFPRSHQMSFVNSTSKTSMQDTNKVLIKLADYSISRCALPTGTKGFAGTEGFMAPEIVRFNGEETYSEKVDCFSFGMLMYELFSLKHPFEGQEQIKDIVLNGGRPVIKTPELFNPTLMLDLMCLCWLDNPAERPNSSELLRYTNSYEFSHLLEVVVLEDFNEMPLVLTCLNQEQDLNFDDAESAEQEQDGDEEVEEEEEDMFDIWVVRNSYDQGETLTQLEILTYENQFNCTNRKMINVCCEKIESMCLYNKNQVWCIDAAKCLFVYCCRTYRKISQYLLDIKSLANIVSMFAIESGKQLLLCSSNGMIVQINLELFHEMSLNNNDLKYEDILPNELEYYINDIGIRINTSLLIPTRADKSFDLWMGSSESEIFSFSLRSMKLTGSYLHSTSYHYLTNSLLVSSTSKNSIIPTRENKQSEVTILKTTTTDTFFLWSYVYPGTTIFLWNHVSKKIMSAYNCKKAIDELNPTQQSASTREIRIVEITFLNGNLYSGFNNGIVLALKRLTLTPLFMFNAHVHQLYNLCPLTFETKLTTYYQNRSRKPTSVVKKTKHTLVSLGRALTPLHEDIYLSSSYYRDRVGALKKYANCLILNTWSCE